MLASEGRGRPFESGRVRHSFQWVRRTHADQILLWEAHGKRWTTFPADPGPELGPLFPCRSGHRHPPPPGFPDWFHPDTHMLIRSNDQHDSRTGLPRVQAHAESITDMRGEGP